jgi:hypothetical protein
MEIIKKVELRREVLDKLPRWEDIGEWLGPVSTDGKIRKFKYLSGRIVYVFSGLMIPGTCIIGLQSDIEKLNCISDKELSELCNLTKLLALSARPQPFLFRS